MKNGIGITIILPAWMPLVGEEPAYYLTIQTYLPSWASENSFYLQAKIGTCAPSNFW